MPPKDPLLPQNAFVPSDGRAPQAPRKGGARFDRLNALFDKNAPLPAAASSRFGTTSSGAMDSRMRMERLRGAVDQAEIESSCDALLRHFQMPEEPDLLCKMMRHSDAAVGERALAELGSMHAAGKLQRTINVREALEAFRPRLKEPNALALLDELLS